MIRLEFFRIGKRISRTHSLPNFDGNPAKEILEYIVEKADEFADGAKQHDDMTLIVVKVL